MADLLTVTTPIMPKDYNLTAKPIVQSDEIFDLVDLSKVIKASDRSDQPTQQDAAFDENAGVIPKLPMLIAKDPSLTAASLKSLLSSDVLNQLAESGNTELLAKLTDLANEILLKPGELLSDLKSQQKSATIFNGDFFNLLRGISSQSTNPDIKAAVMNILKASVNASSGQEILKSLSANMKFLSEQLVPSKALSTELLKLSQLFSSPDAAVNFTELRSQTLSILKDVNNNLLLTDKIKNLLPLITHNLSRFNDSPTALKENLTNLLDLLSNKDLKVALIKSFGEFADSLNLPLDANPSDTADIAKNLAALANTNCKTIDASVLKNSLSSISTQNGVDSLKEILIQVLPKSSEEMVADLLKDFTQTKDLNTLLDKLSVILNSIDSMEVKVPLAQSLNEALSHLSKSEDINYNPPSSMENLVNFLSKNIDDAAMKSLNAFNQNEMVQSLLTAPGVFTPLLHYLVPLQVEDTRAFGELWVDNDAGSSSGSDDTNHFFLSFSVENIGDFELEIYTKSSDISITLMCPENLARSFSKIKDSIARIAASNGFSIKSAKIEPLSKKRNLIDVFPRIIEKRLGLNVKV